MADAKISALPAATTPLAGTEVLPIVQSSATAKVAVSDLTAGRSVSGSNFVVTSTTIPANGIYLPAANTVGIATNSTLRVSVSTTALTVASGVDVALSEGKLTIADTAAERALEVTSAATSDAGTVFINSSLTAGGLGVYAYSNSASTGAFAVLAAANDHPSATGAWCLQLKQDAANAFANFVGTAGANATDPISTFVVTPGALQGWVQVDINATKRWIPFYADPTA